MDARIILSAYISYFIIGSVLQKTRNELKSIRTKYLSYGIPVAILLVVVNHFFSWKIAALLTAIIVIVAFVQDKSTDKLSVLFPNKFSPELRSHVDLNTLNKNKHTTFTPHNMLSGYLPKNISSDDMIPMQSLMPKNKTKL